MFRREVDKFVESFIKALPTKNNSFNRIYIGQIARRYARSEKRKELRTKNPKLSVEKLQKLLHKEEKKFHNFMKL